MKKYTIHSIWMLFISLWISCPAQGQTPAEYTFAEKSRTFSYLGGSPKTLPALKADNAISGTIPIGFTFNFCGKDYTSLKVSSNGWITFNTAVADDYPDNTTASLDLIKPALFPLWDDVSGSGGTASVATYGAAPSRFLVIEYKAWKWNAAASGATLSFQVFLYEGSDIIQFAYKREIGSIKTPADASIGFCDDKGTANFLVIDPSASSFVNSSVFVNDLIGKPATNQVFQFEPPAQCTTPAPGATIAAPSALSCLGDSTLLTIAAAPAGRANSFQWQSSPDNTTYTDITGATELTYRTAPSEETWYRCRVICKYGPDTVLSTPVKVSFVSGPPTSADVARCGDGVVLLSATGTAGTTLTWYTVPTGGVAVGTGSAFTTPVLTDTTDFYVANEANDSTTVVMGAGANTTVSSGVSADKLSPFDHGYGGNKSQYLFTAAELSAMGLKKGNITAAAFDIVSGGSLYKGYSLSIGATTATVLTTTPLTGLTTVYTTTSPAGFTTPASGLAEFTFTTPFAWDGTSNIVLQSCWSNNNTGGTGSTVKYDTTSFVSMNFYRADNKTPDVTCGVTSASGVRSIRPKILFKENFMCSSPRKKITAIVNPLPKPTISPSTGPVEICAGSTTTLTGGGSGDYQWRNAAGPVAGAVGSTFTTGVTGDYQLVITNPVSGCKDSSAIVGVDVHAIPSVTIAPGGTTSVCSDSAQIYTSTATGGGSLSYQWYESGKPISGANSSTYTTSVAGNYTLRVTLASCSDTSNEATLKINPLPVSDFTKTGSTGAICLDDSLELTAIAVPAGYAYQWLFNGSDIPGATRRKYYAQTGGDYSVRIRDVNNCRKESAPQLIISTPMGIPDLSPKDVLFCDGNTIRLYANAGPYAAAYRWTKDTAPLPDTTPSIVTGAGGSYDVTVTDVYGCVATSAKVSVTVVPLPAKPVITYAGSSLSVSGTYSSYQWYRNGKVIPGATKKTLTISFDGDYHVVVSNSSDCYSTSDILKLQNLSVSDIHPAVQIKIYPNPAQSMVYIDAPIPVNLLVRDAQGRRLAELEDAKSVDVSGYADGIYLLTFSDAEGQILGTRQIIRKTE